MDTGGLFVGWGEAELPLGWHGWATQWGFSLKGLLWWFKWKCPLESGWTYYSKEWAVWGRLACRGPFSAFIPSENMAQSFQVFCFFKWFWKSRFKKIHNTSDFKKPCGWPLCSLWPHRKTRELLALCVQGGHGGHLAVGTGLLWLRSPLGCPERRAHGFWEPRGCTLLFWASCPTSSGGLELHSGAYTSSPSSEKHPIVFNAFLELTVINRVDRHVLKVFKKFFSLMAFLPAKGLGAGAMECVSEVSLTWKEEKKENWIWTRHWKLAILSTKGFSHYKSFHHKLPSQCSCWIYNRI